MQRASITTLEVFGIQDVHNILDDNTTRPWKNLDPLCKEVILEMIWKKKSTFQNVGLVTYMADGCIT